MPGLLGLLHASLSCSLQTPVKQTYTTFALHFLQDDSQRDLLIPMQERVAAVKPFWETISQEARTKILTVSVTELKEKAADLAEKQRKQAGKLSCTSHICCNSLSHTFLFLMYYPAP